MNARDNVRSELAERRNGNDPVYADDAGGAALAIREDQTYWTERQVAALASLGIRDATVGDMQMFMHYCLRTGLDPFARQIYLIKRHETIDGQRQVRQTIQVGIDGFRVIRDRLARDRGVIVEYDGDGATWFDANGTEHDMWLTDDPPVACKFRLFVIVPAKSGRDGEPDQPERRLPFVAKLRFESFAQRWRNDDGSPGRLIGQWAVRGEHMIAKCAEAAALRMAFPQDLSGIYTPEELAATAEGPPPDYRPDPPARATVVRGTVREAMPKAGGRRRTKPPETPESNPQTMAELFDFIGVTKTAERVQVARAVLGRKIDPKAGLSPDDEAAVVVKLREFIDAATDATEPPVPEDEIRTPYDNLRIFVEVAEKSDSPVGSATAPAG